MKKYFLSQLSTVCGRHRKSLCKNYGSRDGNKFFFDVNQFLTIYSTMRFDVTENCFTWYLYVLASEHIIITLSLYIYICL